MKIGKTKYLHNNRWLCGPFFLPRKSTFNHQKVKSGMRQQYMFRRQIASNGVRCWNFPGVSSILSSIRLLHSPRLFDCGIVSGVRNIDSGWQASSLVYTLQCSVILCHQWELPTFSRGYCQFACHQGNAQRLWKSLDLPKKRHPLTVLYLILIA